LAFPSECGVSVDGLNPDQSANEIRVERQRPA
jgi:hypothetical protein